MNSSKENLKKILAKGNENASKKLAELFGDICNKLDKSTAELRDLTKEVKKNDYKKGVEEFVGVLNNIKEKYSEIVDSTETFQREMSDIQRETLTVESNNAVFAKTALPEIQKRIAETNSLIRDLELTIEDSDETLREAVEDLSSDFKVQTDRTVTSINKVSDSLDDIAVGLHKTERATKGVAEIVTDFIKRFFGSLVNKVIFYVTDPDTIEITKDTIIKRYGDRTVTYTLDREGGSVRRITRKEE